MQSATLSHCRWQKWQRHLSISEMTFLCRFTHTVIKYSRLWRLILIGNEKSCNSALTACRSLNVSDALRAVPPCGNRWTDAFPHAVIPQHRWLLWFGCDQSAATLATIDSNGLTAAIGASTVNPQADTRMWRKCLVLRSESALGKPLIIQVNGSADGSAPPGCLFQQWVGYKTNGFNVDSRMQEADEQTEGKNK